MVIVIIIYYYHYYYENYKWDLGSHWDLLYDVCELLFFFNIMIHFTVFFLCRFGCWQETSWKQLHARLRTLIWSPVTMTSTSSERWVQGSDPSSSYKLTKWMVVYIEFKGSWVCQPVGHPSFGWAVHKSKWSCRPQSTCSARGRVQLNKSPPTSERIQAAVKQNKQAFAQTSRTTPRGNILRAHFLICFAGSRPSPYFDSSLLPSPLNRCQNRGSTGHIGRLQLAYTVITGRE